MDDTVKVQQEVCANHNADYLEVVDNSIIGVANNILDGSLLPLNGLRHPAEGESSGWYLWVGEELPSNDNFFKPLHVSHLVEKRPELITYLGLAPGWRFIINPDENYEDVWYDEKLKDV